MSDVERYIARRKKTDPEFAEGFEEGYKEFEFGVLLRQAREEAGLTQEQLARLMQTKKDSDFAPGKPCRRHSVVNAEKSGQGIE